MKEYTDEMEDYFIGRTWNHIHTVQSYCSLIEKIDPMFKGLHQISEGDIDPPHDISKFFDEEEREPYIFITWGHNRKKKGIEWSPPDCMKKPMVDAMAHHIKTNKHHPEYWCPLTTNLVNPDALYEMSQTIDATKMPVLYIGEMVADWFATASERGTNTAKFWADKNVNKRWMFTPEQTKIIYDLIDYIPKRERELEILGVPLYKGWRKI
jgi:hypothetical protein